ncbi:hypothetical protein HDU87_003745 [Geranomyces variabilis]|uniref:Elongation of fatty acids protein n=1 Tax=Geranomyces variabilis TaxID=109894 RepID=A0AAD5XR31_9FUNG|nr:hypothetical protein HDU87_003745 [Geranomyces variabilis]
MIAVEDLFIAAGRHLGRVTAPYVDPLQSQLVSLAATAFPTQTLAVQKWLSQTASAHAHILPLMNPFYVALILAGYLAMVFGGRAAMRSLPKFHVKGLMLLHNLFLATLSGYMCIAILSEARTKGYKFVGNDVDESAGGWKMAKLIWLFYVSKTFEFVDTLIMVLKKNDRQISFLHLYHHASIFAVWWLVTLKAPNGEAYFSAALNSFIHVVMYGYYFCMAIGIRQVSFIKRYITAMQMTQFCCMMVQAVLILNRAMSSSSSNPTRGSSSSSSEEEERKPYPTDIAVLLFVYMWTMLGLFANFFVKEGKRLRREKKLAASKKN